MLQVEVGFIPGKQEYFNIYRIKMTYHVNRMQEKKNHIISIDTRKTDKIHHSLIALKLDIEEHTSK